MGAGHAARQTCPQQGCAKGRGGCHLWEQGMEAEVLQLTPGLSPPGNSSIGVAPNPWTVAPQFLPAVACSPGSPTASHERQPWKNCCRRAQSPTPPSPALRIWGGDVRKGPGEPLTIQRAFSTDAFGRRGLQVSTWFGFGSPPPSQLIRLSAERVPHGC